jgi:hypothetical protein
MTLSFAHAAPLLAVERKCANQRLRGKQTTDSILMQRPFDLSIDTDVVLERDVRLKSIWLSAGTACEAMT